MKKYSLPLEKLGIGFMPYLSLIVPVYNRPQEVQELLESLAAQDSRDFEIIIVEDGSTVRCDRIVEQYKSAIDIKYFFKENSGPGLSRNYGAERAEGKYVVFLDSDCIIPRQYTQVVRQACQEAGVDAFGGPDRAHDSFTNIQKAINYSMTSFFTTGGIRGQKQSMEKFHPRSFNMGFSQEVLKNYFHMAGVTVLNSIWMDQMVICLYSQQQDAFTELTGCITRARDYLAEERKIPVACGVSGAYEGMERLTQAYGEAASFIREYSAQEARLAFDSMTKGMKRICGLEEQIIRSLSREDQSQTSDLLTEMIEELETLLGYQDVSVKLNFGRSLMTIIRGINQIPGIRVKTSEAARRFEKLGQLNFNGDNLKYHVDYFSEMKIQRV